MSEDLGIDVGDRLRELETAMLRQDPALSLVESLHHVSEHCPYLGLEAFTLSDADAFFGRNADIDAIRDRVRPGALVVVVGAVPARANPRSCSQAYFPESPKGDASRS